MISRVIELALARRLRALAQQQRVTTYITWLSALVALISDETKQPDVIVGTYMTNRRRVEVRDMLGYFVNFVIPIFKVEDARRFVTGE